MTISENEWREVIIDALVVCYIYNASHDNNPKKALEDLINWNCQVALDPLVSSDAQVLINNGYANGYAKGLEDAYIV